MVIKYFSHFFFLLTVYWGNAQQADYKQLNFCNNLNKVFELGRYDNFDTYDGTMVKQSPILQVPGYSIKLENFPVTYADKDHRFVAKTNENLDSLTALKKLEELKLFVGFCLDTMQWQPWQAMKEDDAATVFLKEHTRLQTTSKDLRLTLAVLSVVPRVYTLAMYVKRR